MANEWDALFASVRRSPFQEDPNAIPQEGSTAGVEPSGWLQDGAVTADVIRANSVETDKLAANAVTADKIAANTITANEIAANTITANEIAANTITAGEIAANTISASEIAADSITTSELAANAVITENVLAANITSSRIELTVSGKNFGANDGSIGSPGVFFDSQSDLGVLADGGEIYMGTGGSSFDPWVKLTPGFDLVTVGNASLLTSPSVVPHNDTHGSLGTSGSRWAEVWAVDGTINTSDGRLKTDIEESDLGLEFISSLRPRRYRWKETADTQANEMARSAVDVDAHRAELAPLVDEVQAVRSAQLAGEITDDEAEWRVEELRLDVRSLREEHLAPMAAYGARRPGRRFHYGLIAQEVKESLDEAGVDASIWKQDPTTGSQALAYTELIAPLIRAVQELSERLARLEGR